MYTYRDFSSGKIRGTRGKFSHWSDPTGPLNVQYAIFANKRGIVCVPKYFLTKETKEQIEKLEQDHLFEIAVETFFEKHSEIIKQAGLTVSKAKWVDNEIGKAYICSIESTPGTYGNPAKEFLYSHETGKVS